MKRTIQRLATALALATLVAAALPRAAQAQGQVGTAWRCAPNAQPAPYLTTAPCAAAPDLSAALAERAAREREHRQLLVASTALLVADWGQTRYMAERGIRELNVVLGPHPSRGRVDAYFASVLVGHWLLGTRLEEPWRRRWLVGITALEGGVVARNLALGIRFSF